MGHGQTHQTVHELFNRRDFDGLDAHTREDMVYEDIPRGLTMKNRGEFKDWLGGWAAAFSDARADSATYHEGADFSLATFTGRGRNDGALGPLPATGREMHNPFWELLHYDDEGQIVAAEIHYDQMTLLAQLGHVEPPA